MAHDLSEDQSDVLAELEGHKKHGEDLAQMFADHRAAVRERALVAITHYGVSIARASAAAGVDRRTLTTWLQVWNAEQKGRQK